MAPNFFDVGASLARELCRPPRSALIGPKRGWSQSAAAQSAINLGIQGKADYQATLA